MNKIKSKLKFINYIVEKIEFETNLDFSGNDPEIDFDLNNEYKIEGKSFILTLDVEVFPEAKKNDYPFTLKIKMIGVFEVESDVDEKTTIEFAERNSIAILFPYLRALASVYTSNANIGNLILPPINVVKYLQDKKAKANN